MKRRKSKKKKIKRRIKKKLRRKRKLRRKPKRSRKRAKKRSLRRRKKRKKTKRVRRKKSFISEKMEELIEKGASRKFVTYSEILHYFPEIEKDIKGLEELYGELEKRGIELGQTSIFSVPDFGYQAGRFVIKRMIQDGSLPRAIITISDNLAFGAISELKHRGLDIPQDVAIIGYNDVLPSSIVDPRLTSVALPLYEMGRQAMVSLNLVLKGNLNGWLRKSFSGYLVIRDSCGCKT